MSVCIYFASFNPQKADQKWQNFDVSIKEKIYINQKIRDLEKRWDDLNEYRALSEEEIYNPTLRNQANKKRVEMAQARYEIEQELKDLKDKSNFEPGIYYYIQKQQPIEQDIIIPMMIELDLCFGGKIAYYSSALDPISHIPLTLNLLFKELSLDKYDMLRFTKEQWIGIVTDPDELDERFAIHKKELLEKKVYDITNEKDFEAWQNEVKTQLSKMRPIIKEIAENAQFVTWTDSEGSPKLKLLTDRAIFHIKEFKNHILMKVPLQNYQDSK